MHTHTFHTLLHLHARLSFTCWRLTHMHTWRIVSPNIYTHVTHISNTLLHEHTSRTHTHCTHTLHTRTYAHTHAHTYSVTFCSQFLWEHTHCTHTIMVLLHTLLSSWWRTFLFRYAFHLFLHARYAHIFITRTQYTVDGAVRNTTSTVTGTVPHYTRMVTQCTARMSHITHLTHAHTVILKPKTSI